jgi:general stress protein 26
MQEQEARNAALALADRCAVAMLGTNGDEGFPNIKAMLKFANEGLAVLWFSTNTSSRRVAQMGRDQRVCVYFLDQERFEGLMLLGMVELLQDHASRQRLWSDGCLKYYPLGVDDPDYTVLRFCAQRANYYHGLSNVIFAV